MRNINQSTDTRKEAVKVFIVSILCALPVAVYVFTDTPTPHAQTYANQYRGELLQARAEIVDLKKAIETQQDTIETQNATIQILNAWDMVEEE